MTNKNALEKNYDQAIKDINAQLSASAEALEKANQIAEENGIECLQIPSYLYDERTNKEIAKIQEVVDQIDSSALYEQLERFGWQMSSIGC